MRGVSESMAGRAAVLRLLPFSAVETKRVTLLAGSFPEAIARPRTRDLWMSSYVPAPWWCIAHRPGPPPRALSPRARRP